MKTFLSLLVTVALHTAALTRVQADAVQPPPSAESYVAEGDRFARLSEFDKAIDAYRQRLVELEQDRADAECDNDPERLQLIDREREALLTQLKNAIGLAGRSRQLGATASERARKAVHARIRDAIRRLESSAPQLAAHLDRAVITGTWCRYRSQGAPSWQIRW